MTFKEPELSFQPTRSVNILNGTPNPQPTYKLKKITPARPFAPRRPAHLKNVFFTSSQFS